MSPRTIVRSLVVSLGGDGDRTAAESLPPAPPPLAKAFVRVLVGFGVVTAMVGVVDVSIVGLKMARNER